MQIQKKFSGSATLKECVEELKEDGCKEITKILPLEDGRYEVSFTVDEFVSEKELGKGFVEEAKNAS